MPKYWTSHRINALWPCAMLKMNRISVPRPRERLAVLHSSTSESFLFSKTKLHLTSTSASTFTFAGLLSFWRHLDLYDKRGDGGHDGYAQKDRRFYFRRGGAFQGMP